MSTDIDIARTLSKGNVSMDDLIAEITTNSIANNTTTSVNNNTSMADYSIDTDADRTQPLLIAKHPYVNTMMPPVPDSPEPSPTSSPKKVTFADDSGKTINRVLPPLVHDLSMHSMPELPAKNNWDSESDDSDLTLASPVSKRKGEEEMDGVLDGETSDRISDRIMLDTVKNGLLVDQVVDLGIAQGEADVVENQEKLKKSIDECVEVLVGDLVEELMEEQIAEHIEDLAEETVKDEVGQLAEQGEYPNQTIDNEYPFAESSTIEPTSDSVIYSPIKTEEAINQLESSLSVDNPFLDDTPPQDTSISSFHSTDYVLELPFEDSLYEPLKSEESVQPKKTTSSLETSVFDIWKNQNPDSSIKTSKVEFDCIKSPIKSAIKVVDSNLHVKVLDKRIYSNSSSVIDRLEVKPIRVTREPTPVTPEEMSMLTVDFTDMTNHGFTIDDADEYVGDSATDDLISNSSLQLLKSVWNLEEKKHQQLAMMLTHSDTFERLHNKTKSLLMQDKEVKMIFMPHGKGTITENELQYWPSQRGEYVHEDVDTDYEDADYVKDAEIQSVIDLGISLPKGNISPARKTMVEKFEQSRKQMEMKKEHEKLQDSLKYKLREQARKEELLRPVAEPEVTNEPLAKDGSQEAVVPTSAPIPTGPDHIFINLCEVRDIRIPDLRKYNGKVQIVLDNGSHIIKTAFYPLDYHGVVKINEEFELLMNPFEKRPQQVIMTLKLTYDAPKDRVVYTQPKKQYQQVKTKWWKKSETVEVKSEPVKSVIKAADSVKGYIAPDGSFAKYKLDLTMVSNNRRAKLSCFNEWMRTKVQTGSVKNEVVENICSVVIDTKKCGGDNVGLSIHCGDVIPETMQQKPEVSEPGLEPELETMHTNAKKEAIDDLYVL